MQRITERDLEGVVRRINRTINGTDEVPVYSRDDAGKLTANIGVFYIDHAYGGVELRRIVNENGGCTDVLSVGHCPKRELYTAMHAFLRGVEAQVAS